MFQQFYFSLFAILLHLCLIKKKLMTDDENPFVEQMLLLKNNELINILNNKEDYQPEVYEAALQIAGDRNLLKAAEAEKKLSADKTEASSEKHDFTLPDIKNGLNNLIMTVLLLSAAFIIATIFNWNFDDPNVGNGLITVLSLLGFFLKIKFFKNEENQDSQPNTFSDFTVWLAEPYIDISRYGNKISKGLNNRRRFINIMIAIPFVCLNFLHQHQHDYYTSNMDKNSDSVSYNHQSNDISAMQDSIKKRQSEVDTALISMARWSVKDGDSLFARKNFKAALVKYKEALAWEKSDTNIYCKTADCFIRLNQKDSAVTYWNKASELGCFGAKKKLKKYT